MEKSFWLEKWDNLQIGFHQSQVNGALIKYWNSLIKDKKIVFVPLCGASIDMLWLREQGLHVIGVELSEKAILKFLHEHNLKYEKDFVGEFTKYTSDSLELYCGDIFQFTQWNHIDCIYDRASLIALPIELRKSYATLLKTHLANADYFLITIDFDNAELGPPFSVDKTMVEDLFQETFQIQMIAQETSEEVNVHTEHISRMNHNLFLLQQK